MNHGFKLHSDGTLEITMPKGVKVGRVLVQEEGTHDGGLFYPESDAPDTNVDDTISRQKILRAFEEMCSCTDYGWDERDFRDLIKKIPSTESEIIRCKDCKYWNNGNCNCEDIRVDCSDYYVGDLVTEEDFFCGFAKRRENE